MELLEFEAAPMIVSKQNLAQSGLGRVCACIHNAQRFETLLQVVGKLRKVKHSGVASIASDVIEGWRFQVSLEESERDDVKPKIGKNTNHAQKASHSSTRSKPRQFMETNDKDLLASFSESGSESYGSGSYADTSDLSHGEEEHLHDSEKREETFVLVDTLEQCHELMEKIKQYYKGKNWEEVDTYHTLCN